MNSGYAVMLYIGLLQSALLARYGTAMVGTVRNVFFIMGLLAIAALIVGIAVQNPPPKKKPPVPPSSKDEKELYDDEDTPWLS